MKLTITPKNQANALDSNLRFKLKSGFSNSIFFNIQKPKKDSGGSQGGGVVTPTEDINNARLISSLDIHAYDYEEDGVYYIKYDLTLTVRVTGITISNDANYYSTSVLCSASDESVTLGVGPWDFEFNGTTYSTSNIKIDGSDSTWSASGVPMNPHEHFIDDTGEGVTASYSGVTGTWDATATVTVTCHAPNSGTALSVNTLSDINIDKKDNTKESK